MQRIIIILIFIGFVFHGFQFFSIGSLGVSPSDFFIFVLIIYISFQVILNRTEISLPNHSLPKIVLLFLVAAFISGITPVLDGSGKQITQFFKSFAHLFYLFLFGFFAFILNQNEKEINRIIKALLVISVLINIYSFYQLVARVFDLPFAWVELNSAAFSGRGEQDEVSLGQLALKYKNFYRATSIFSEPSSLASWNLLILSILIPFITNVKATIVKNRKYIFFLFILSILTLLITFSLTAFVGLLVLFVFSFYIASNKNKLVILKYFLIGVASVIIVDMILTNLLEVSVLNMLFERVGNIITSIITGKVVLSAGDSSFHRFDKFMIVIDDYLDYPIFGVGTGLFSYYNPPHLFTDNSIAQIISENGIIGIISFTLIFFSSTYSVLYFLKKNVRLNKLSDNQIALLQIAGFISVYEFFINFGPGNIHIALGFWVPMFLCFSIITLVLKKFHHPSLKLKYFNSKVGEKIKLRFARKLQYYK